MNKQDRNNVVALLGSAAILFIVCMIFLAISAPDIKIKQAEYSCSNSGGIESTVYTPSKEGMYFTCKLGGGGFTDGTRYGTIFDREIR